MEASHRHATEEKKPKRDEWDGHLRPTVVGFNHPLRKSVFDVKEGSTEVQEKQHDSRGVEDWPDEIQKLDLIKVVWIGVENRGREATDGLRQEHQSDKAVFRILGICPEDQNGQEKNGQPAEGAEKGHQCPKTEWLGSSDVDVGENPPIVLGQ